MQSRRDADFGAASPKVTFKGSGSSDPDGDALIRWDFGDGTAKSTRDPVHTYDKGGTSTPG